MCLDDGMLEMVCTVCTWRGSLGQAKQSVILGPNFFKCPQCGQEIKEAPALPLIITVCEVAPDGELTAKQEEIELPEANGKQRIDS